MPRIRQHLTFANVVSVIALFVALGGGAYALGRGDVKTRNIADGAVTKPKLHQGAVTSPKVQDFGLRLHDLGGKTNNGKATVDSTINVPNNECRQQHLTLFGTPVPRGVIGSLVVGFLTDDHGHAVLDNAGVIVPTMVSESSQGGAVPNLIVCNLGAPLGETVPAGSVFHFHLVGP
jgi:hypothetical protein